MFLTDRIITAQREAAKRVADGKTYSVEIPLVGRVPVPSPRQLAIYAALGGLAALEVIEWPVAVAMGVGTALISHEFSGLEEREAELEEAVGLDTAETPRPAPQKSPKKAPKKTPAKAPAD